VRVLVTGGVRSGKSQHAEDLMDAWPSVAYVATGPAPDPLRDADWAARVAAHRVRRPAGWTTHETPDLAAALRIEEPVLVDCLGTWLTRVLDEEDLWEQPTEEVHAVAETRLTDAADALASRALPTVLVTNEVGLGVVPEHRSGRLFRDLLGLVNQRLAAHCDEVHLVVAGRTLVL
jgi:adenosylcobinamide kinase/adenosylcobinamide-phosphate guanylyltransferase